MSEHGKPICKGDMRLGTGCGECAKCLDQIERGELPPEPEEPTVRLGDHAVVMPIGFGVGISGAVSAFDRNLVGLVFKGLPDDLIAKAEAGDLAGSIDLSKLDDAPTVFLRCADPESLYELADMASKLAEQWEEHSK